MAKDTRALWFRRTVLRLVTPFGIIAVTVAFLWPAWVYTCILFGAAAAGAAGAMERGGSPVMGNLGIVLCALAPIVGIVVGRILTGSDKTWKRQFVGSALLVGVWYVVLFVGTMLVLRAWPFR